MGWNGAIRASIGGLSILLSLAGTVHAASVPTPTVTVTVPKVTVPTVTVPKVTVPTVTVPKVSVPTPKVAVPTVTVTAPKVSVPTQVVVPKTTAPTPSVNLVAAPATATQTSTGVYTGTTASGMVIPNVPANNLGAYGITNAPVSAASVSPPAQSSVPATPKPAVVTPASAPAVVSTPAPAKVATPTPAATPTYTFVTTTYGTVQVSKNGSIIGTMTPQLAAQQYGYQAPGVNAPTVSTSPTVTPITSGNVTTPSGAVVNVATGQLVSPPPASTSPSVQTSAPVVSVSTPAKINATPTLASTPPTTSAPPTTAASVQSTNPLPTPVIVSNINLPVATIAAPTAPLQSTAAPRSANSNTGNNNIGSVATELVQGGLGGAVSQIPASSVASGVKLGVAVFGYSIDGIGIVATGVKAGPSSAPTLDLIGKFGVQTTASLLATTYNAPILAAAVTEGGATAIGGAALTAVGVGGLAGVVAVGSYMVGTAVAPYTHLDDFILNPGPLPVASWKPTVVASSIKSNPAGQLPLAFKPTN